jgi:hypothetical protein
MKPGTPPLCLFLAGLAILAACETLPNDGQDPVLLFQTGFAGTTVALTGSQTAKFKGADPGFDGRGSWAELEGGKVIGTFLINYEAGEYAQRRAAIVLDPEDALNPVAEFRIDEPHIVEGDHMKGRVSAILEGLSGVRGFSQTIRLRLDPSLACLRDWERKIDWLTLFEFWCGEGDRLTVSLYKQEGAGKPLRWRFTKDRLGLFGWNREWEETAEDDEVECGAWMKLGLSVRAGKEGEARSWLGREEDGEWTTLIDTAEAVGGPEGFAKLNPFKLYTSDRLIEYVRSRGATLSVLWDDWKLWLNDGIGS